MQSLVITLGDPKSINIEILCHTLHDAKPTVKHIIIGSKSQWLWQCKVLGLTIPFQFQDRRSLTKEDLSSRHHLFLNTDLESLDAAHAQTLVDDEKFRQHCAIRSLNSVADLCRLLDESSRLAVLTMPINKAVAKSEKFPFPGQTEFFSSIWPPHQSVMILAGPRLRVALSTNHLALKEVTAKITCEVLEQKIMTFHQSLKEVFSIPKPRIAVAALNPHAGDQGLFGHEDQTILAPCIEKIRHLNPNIEVSGPYPADTVFYWAYQGQFDGVLAMYHDQGLGPLKTVHFHDAINVTGGLRHLRVSPDHGPAENLFLQNKASTESVREAYDLCLSYLRK